MTNSAYLIEAGKNYEGVKVCLSNPHMLLMRLSQEHAEFMATHQQQGHQNFQKRWDIIHEQLNLSATEIAAESWDRQADAPLNEIGTEMFRSWELSRGHWRVASTKHKFYGAAMEQGKNGVYYGVIITAD